MPYFKIKFNFCVADYLDTAEYDSKEEARKSALSHIEDMLRDQAKSLSEEADIVIRESGRREISEYLERERRFEEELKKHKWE